MDRIENPRAVRQLEERDSTVFARLRPSAKLQSTASIR